MSLDRTRFAGPPADGVRDSEAAFDAAYLEEFNTYRAAGLTERANEVAVVLRQRGIQVDKAPTGVKERAVADAPLETAVEDEKPKPAKRARTAKTETE